MTLKKTRLQWVARAAAVALMVGWKLHLSWAIEPSESISSWPKLSAGVREMYLTPEGFSFGSDNMSRLKYAIEKKGFSSFTLAVRLGLKNQQDSYVYAPVLRTKLHELQAITSRILVSDDEIVIKPMLSKLPGLGVADRLTGLSPSQPALFFATYTDCLNLYFGLARKYGVSEIVLGVGMGNLWSRAFSKYWVELSQFAEQRVGDRTRLSIELISETDFGNLEDWKTNDPGSFQKLSDRLTRIRVAGTQMEKVPFYVSRAQALFPIKKITLSNVTIPRCVQSVWDEDEVQCEIPHLPSSSAPVPQPEIGQAQRLALWLKGFDDLPEQVRAFIVEIEFRETATQFEPPENKKDPRFLHDNGLTRDVLLQWRVLPREAPAPQVSPPVVPRAPDIFEARSNLGDGSGFRKLASVPQIAFSGAIPGNFKKACIYFDRVNSQDKLGAIHMSMLRSLIGSFRDWESSGQEIQLYQKSQLEKCQAIFYIASNFNLEPPKGFYEDLAQFSLKNPVVWMNYRFSYFAKAYNAAALSQGLPALGFDVTKVEQPLVPPTAQQPDPGYYRYFDYKGETFEKPAKWNYQINAFGSSPELNIVQITDSSHVSALAVARHSKLDAKTPYGILRAHSQGGSVWYFNDLPFAFVDSGTPYFILCDLLWDIFGQTPPDGPPNALVRIEDVNPSQSQHNLRWVIDYLADHNIPFSLAVIPYYTNMFDDPIEGTGSYVWKPADEYPDFVGSLKYAKSRGADFVFHGVEHTAGDLISGFSGATAADYEFWMYPANTPHPKDSVDYILNKLERGEAVFNRLGIPIRSWESPHYAASGLDYLLFGKLFRWVYHRPIYFDAKITSDVDFPLGMELFQKLNITQREKRREILRKVKMEGDFHTFGGQIVPYPVYSDCYGQSVIPETLGFIDYPFYPDDPKRGVSHASDLLKHAKRLKVIRGAFASFFWHADLMVQKQIYYELHPENFAIEGGKNTLINMIEGLQKLGYRFRSIEDRTLFPDLWFVSMQSLPPLLQKHPIAQ